MIREPEIVTLVASLRARFLHLPDPYMARSNAAAIAFPDAGHRWPDDVLLADHACEFSTEQDVFVELRAYREDATGPHDWVPSWGLLDSGGHQLEAVLRFCPFCGSDLMATLRGRA